MTIKEFKKMLLEGVVTFKYRKIHEDGTSEERPARGTMKPDLLPKSVPVRKFKCTHIVWDTSNIEGSIPKLPSHEIVRIPVDDLEGLDPKEVYSYVCDVLSEKHKFLIDELAIDEVLNKQPKKMPEGNVFYFDLDKNGYRSFTFANLIEC